MVISQRSGVWTRKRAIIFLFWAVVLHNNQSPSVSTMELETRVDFQGRLLKEVCLLLKPSSLFVLLNNRRI